MTVTLLYYNNENMYKGESSHTTNTGITIDQFFKLRNMDPKAYFVTVNGKYVNPGFRLYDKIMIKVQAVNGY